MYFGFHARGLKDSVKIYEEIEEDARKAVMESGGSLSHHHGVGKIRKMFMPKVIGKTGIELIKGIKEKLDPTNIFASNNLIDFDNKN